MTKPLVSVLIPLYNHARFIEQCLDSLLAEGWPNLEVLVLDDGSVDDSFRIAQGWRVRNPKSFTRFFLGTQSNLGITKTLNRLVEMSCGSFVTVLASDDYLLPFGVQNRVEYLEKNVDSMAVIGNCFIVDIDGELVSRDGAISYKKRVPKSLLSKSSLRKELLFNWWVPGPTLLVRKEVYSVENGGIGKYAEEFSFEDRDFYLRLIGRNLLSFQNYSVASYRIDISVALSKGNDKILADEIEIESNNISKFSSFEQVGLWIKINRTKAKLEQRVNKQNILPIIKFWSLQLVWAVFTVCWRTLEIFKR